MGLTGTPAAFARGFEIGEERRKEKRLHQYQLEDEQRQLNVQDWFQQRSAIRDRAKKLNLQGDDLKAEEAKIAELTGKINDAYHPAKAPGALQRDWHFLQGLLHIHGRGDKPAPAPPTIAGTKTPDVTIQQPDETVKLSALPADVTTPVTPPTTAAGADQTQQAFDKLPPIPGLAANLNPFVHAASRAYTNVPPALIAAVIGQESGGKTTAVSSKGATGVMQLMPETASLYGVKDATNPSENIMAGTHYLSDLLKKHGGDPAEALKDYYGRGKAPAGDPTTEGYAQQVLGSYNSILAKQPELAKPVQPTPAATPAPTPAAPAAPAQPGAATLSPFEQVKMQTMPGARLEQDITLPSAPITIPGTTQPTVVGPSAATMAVPKAKGLVAAGNLPIWDASANMEGVDQFTDDTGKTILVPKTINGVDGKENYQKTGQMLGVFADPKSADVYAKHFLSRGDRKQPDAAKYETKQSKQEKAQEAAKDKAAQEAAQFMAAGPLTPTEEAQSDIAKKSAQIDATMEIAKKLMGDDWDEEDQKDFKESLISATLGSGTKEKYFSQIIPMEDPVTKETRYYRVPMSGAPPQEITGFRGKTMVPKPTAGAKGGGSDFWKTVVAKYGSNPTSEQIEAERQIWTMAGARGSETITDAAGNTIRVPTFASGQPIPAGLIAGDSTGGAGGDVSGAGAASSQPATSTPAGPSAPPTPSSPAFVQPDPDQATQALAEADRLGIGDGVRAVANYQMPESDVAASRGGQRGKFMQLVLKVNPGYSSARYKLVSDTVSSFGPRGDDGKALKSLNTAIHHVGTLLGYFDKLGNSDLPAYNRMKNFVSSNVGSPEVVQFNAAAKAVADETGRVFRQSGLTEAEAQAWLSNLNPNMSPAQMQGAVDSIIDLLSGRMIAETTSYKGVMGNLSGFPVLDDEALDVLRGGRIKERGAIDMLRLDQEARQSAPRSVAPAQQAPPPAPVQAKGQISMAEAKKKYPQASEDDIRRAAWQQGLVVGP